MQRLPATLAEVFDHPAVQVAAAELNKDPMLAKGVGTVADEIIDAFDGRFTVVEVVFGCLAAITMIGDNLIKQGGGGVC